MSEFVERAREAVAHLEQAVRENPQDRSLQVNLAAARKMLRKRMSQRQFLTHDGPHITE